MISTLDSTRLLNLKQRHGILISSGNSTGVYTISRKCERKLKEKLESFFNYKTDLDIAVSKVIDKINDVAIFNTLIEYIENTESDQLLSEIVKIKSFISKIKKMSTKVDHSFEEEVDEDEFINF